MDEAALQRLREASGLSLRRDGRFFHHGEPVEHARTVAVLHQGVHRAPDGRWATRIGREWGYLDVEDAAYFVRRLIPGVPLRVQLASGAWTEADPATVASGADDALYLRVAGERARLTQGAQLELLDAVTEDGAGYALLLDGRRFPIGRDTGPEPIRVAGTPPPG